MAARRLVWIVEQHDVAGQFLVFGSQAVESPRTKRRATGQHAAGVHLANAADVVQAIGRAAADDRDVVDAGGDFGIPIADPCARLAMLPELALAAEQIGVGGAAHRRHWPHETIGQRLAGQLVERRLGIEQVDVARPAVHEAPDDRFGFWLRRRKRAFRTSFGSRTASHSIAGQERR